MPARFKDEVELRSARDSDFLKFDEDDGRRQDPLRPHGLRFPTCCPICAALRSIAVELPSVLVEMYRRRHRGGSSRMPAGGQGPVQGRRRPFPDP